MVPLLRTLAFSVIVFACCLSNVWAHKVNIFAYVEDGKVYTESYFASGQKVIGAKIEVRDANGQEELTGTTDKEGLFSFPLTEKKALTIVIDAGMGHKNSYVLSKDEME